jgi:serine/threonine-protein kinase RsbW
MKRNFQIGCSLDNLKSIRDFVRQSLNGSSCNEACVDEIVLALDEMCSNVMIHAHQCNPQHQLDLLIDSSEKYQIVFEITDDSQTFNINTFHEPEINSLISEKRKGGLGIRLVKSIMSSIEYIEKDGKVVCRLIKKLNE